jgi:hypothetical protein
MTSIQPLQRTLLAALAASLLAAVLGPAVASAGEPPAATGEASALAQTLFEEGRRLMEEKRYPEACPKFEESLHLRPGTGTLLNLALCNEQLGKTATAWAQFKEVLFAAKKEGNQAREAFAGEHIGAIEPRLSRLQINAEPTPGLAIRRDGQEIPAAALGTPVPIDPGEHSVEATAPGYSVWSSSVQIGPSADQKVVAVPKLSPLAGNDRGVAPPPAAPAPAPDAGRARRTAGFIVGGAGVAALGIGAVLGILAAGEASSAEDDPALCPGKRCTPAGRDAIDAASTKALVSSIGFGVGIAAVGAGAILILTARSSDAATPPARPPALTSARLVPAAGPDGGGLVVAGTF